MPAVRITSLGRNHGKTMLASRLIEELTARGYRVAAIKQSHHALPADKPGSDTDRFAHAGAAAVVFCGRDGSFVRTPNPADNLRAALGRISADVDLAVVEGFRDEGGSAAIRLAGSPLCASFEREDGTAVLVVDPRDVAALADAVERALLTRRDPAGRAP